MGDRPEDLMPPRETLHCRTCGATRECTAGELHGFIVDDPTWPRCCGVRMAVLNAPALEAGSEGAA